jgi:hypothetical protein
MKDDKPIIQLTPPQQAVFWSRYRMLWMLWRRQGGKSFLFGNKALSRCIQRRNHLACYVSGSLNMGQEIIIKETQVWTKLIDAMRLAALAAGKQLVTNADDDKGQLLDAAALADLLEHSKLECTIRHSNTAFSRTRVLSPNPDTARGYSGDVFGDECAFWPDFRATMDAVEPIISRNREWLLWLATSPPADDGHPTFEMLLPQRDSWPINAAGNWYETNADDEGSGYPVHRADAYDFEAAGLPLYSLKTGEPILVDEARKIAIDKDAFDRNYKLIFVRGGASALSLADLLAAQERGKDGGLAILITEQLHLAA